MTCFALHSRLINTWMRVCYYLDDSTAELLIQNVCFSIGKQCKTRKILNVSRQNSDNMRIYRFEIVFGWRVRLAIPLNDDDSNNEVIMFAALQSNHAAFSWWDPAVSTCARPSKTSESTQHIQYVLPMREWVFVFVAAYVRAASVTHSYAHAFQRTTYNCDAVPETVQSQCAQRDTHARVDESRRLQLIPRRN